MFDLVYERLVHKREVPARNTECNILTKCSGFGILRELKCESFVTTKVCDGSKYNDKLLIR